MRQNYIKAYQWVLTAKKTFFKIINTMLIHNNNKNKTLIS